MIIISKSSAQATKPIRTGRYPLAHRQCSAARTDTPRYGRHGESAFTQRCSKGSPSPCRSGVVLRRLTRPLMTPLPLMTLSMLTQKVGRLWRNGSEADRAHGPVRRQGGRERSVFGDTAGAAVGRRAQSVFRWRRSVDGVHSGDKFSDFLGYFGSGVTTRRVSSGSIMVSTGSCSRLTW